MGLERSLLHNRGEVAQRVDLGERLVGEPTEDVLLFDEVHHAPYPLSRSQIPKPVVASPASCDRKSGAGSVVDVVEDGELGAP